MKIQYRRQGDVIIKPSIIPDNLDNLARKNDLVLATGENTGHSHRIVKGQAELLINATLGLMYLKILSDVAELYHEEHQSVVLPMGDYEVLIQREWDWFTEETRKVMD